MQLALRSTQRDVERHSILVLSGVEAIETANNHDFRFEPFESSRCFNADIWLGMPNTPLIWGKVTVTFGAKISAPACIG